MLEALNFTDQQPGKLLRLSRSLTVGFVSWYHKAGTVLQCIQQLCYHHNSIVHAQEAKAQAISAKVVQCVVPLLSSDNLACRQLSCQVLASLAQLFQGRMAVLQSDGIAAVVSALHSTADEGATCLQVCKNGVTRLCIGVVDRYL